MPLPILPSRPDPSPSDLLRLHAGVFPRWVEHLAEPTSFDWGTAFINPALNRVHDANHVRNARIPEGSSPAEVIQAAADYFRQNHSICHYWHTNDLHLADYLLHTGYQSHPSDVLSLRQTPHLPIRETPGLTLIPARASFKHMRDLASQSAHEADPPAAAHLTEANLLHLDDPHVEGILALKDGQAAGQVLILAAGEIGSIEHVYVASPFRRQGIARTLLSRALQSCARSTFRHIFITVRPNNTIASQLYASLGFQKIGQSLTYRVP